MPFTEYEDSEELMMRKSLLNVERLSLLSTAMAMSAAVSHAMELRPKMRYEPPVYVRLHRTLYPNFGRIAGPAEVVAVVTTAVLAWWTRKQQPAAFPLVSTAAGCLAAAHGIFWGVVQPVNVEMVKWPLDAIPADWARVRDRWEYGHAVRAGLVTIALGALAWSLTDDQSQDSRRNEPC
jgi:anthrone oxygenase-like protein